MAEHRSTDEGAFDFVKIPKNLDLDLPIFPLLMGLTIAEGNQAWDECMEKIRIKGRAFI